MRKRTLPNHIDNGHRARTLPLVAWMAAGSLGQHEESLWIYLMFRFGGERAKGPDKVYHEESLTSIGKYLGVSRQNISDACTNLVNAKLIYADTTHGHTATTVFRAHFGTTMWDAYVNGTTKAIPKVRGDACSEANFALLCGRSVYLAQWNNVAAMGGVSRHIFRMAVIFRTVPSNQFSRDMWEFVGRYYNIPLNTFQKAWRRLVREGLIDEKGTATSGKPMDAASVLIRRTFAAAS